MPAWGKKYYLIEQVGVEYWKRYLTKIGKLPMTGDWTDTQEPEFGLWEDAFRWDTYRGATHFLARWKMPGTYRVMWVDEDNDEFEWAVDGPKELDRFDERDWQEFHEMNGKSQ